MENPIKILGKKIHKREKAIRTPLRKVMRLNGKLSNSKSPESYTFQFFLENMPTIISKNCPFRLVNVPSMFGYPDNVENQVKNILEKAGSGVLDISVSANKDFSGHYLDHKTISLSFAQFLDYQGEYNLYLAQFPLFERRSKKDSLKSLNELFAGHKMFQDFCLGLNGEIHRINLWFSKKETFSKLHYDSYDNFLFMLKGKKVFYLYPPNEKGVVSESIITNSFHQSKRVQKNIESRIKITLTENQIVFVPQGWYHEVASVGSENIIALNVWFNSIEDLCNGREKYLLKYLIAKQLETEIKEELLPNYKKSILGTFRSQKIPFGNANEITKTFQEDEEIGRTLFLASLLEIPKHRARPFILDFLISNPKMFEKILLGMSYIGVECLTRILEEIDEKFPTSFEAKNKESFINIDEFYTTLNQTIDFKTVTEYFIDCKKCLRELVLKTSFMNKLCSPYKF